VTIVDALETGKTWRFLSNIAFTREGPNLALFSIFASGEGPELLPLAQVTQRTAKSGVPAVQVFVR
jgi:hypothetical protein